MNRSYVRFLVEFLPEDSCYFVRNGVGRDRPSQHALALNDPKFGWNWSKSLFEDGLEIPWVIGHQPLLDASSYLRGAYIESMDQVLTLAGPLSTTMRNLLRGLLICRDATLVGIADWMRLPLEVVTLYEQLFFNVRDRLDDPGYIAQLLHPDGFRLNRDADDEDLLLLRTGFRHGAREVARLVGFQANGGGPSLDQLRVDFERDVLRAGAARARRGGDQDLDSPAAAAAMKLIVAEKRMDRDLPPPNRMGDALTDLSDRFSLVNCIKEMTQPDVDRMIELNKENADAAKRAVPAAPA
jgi:hypothetical protein